MANKPAITQLRRNETTKITTYVHTHTHTQTNKTIKIMANVLYLKTQ